MTRPIPHYPSTEIHCSHMHTHARLHDVLCCMERTGSDPKKDIPSTHRTWANVCVCATASMTEVDEEDSNQRTIPVGVGLVSPSVGFSLPCRAHAQRDGTDGRRRHRNRTRLTGNSLGSGKAKREWEAHVPCRGISVPAEAERAKSMFKKVNVGLSVSRCVGALDGRSQTRVARMGFSFIDKDINGN